MKQFNTFRRQLFESTCPLATQDVNVNIANRQLAIEDYNYGPANPNEPGTYWEDAAIIWGIEPNIAKTMTCGNCAAFDVSDKMRSCIEAGIKGTEKNISAMATIEKADLGYCNLLHFKCAGTRSCKIWLTDGPIDNADIA